MKLQTGRIDFYEELKSIAENIAACESREFLLQQMNFFDKAFLQFLPKDETLFYYSFLDALYTRVNKNREEEHIYLKQYEVPQINLFELLIQHYPPVNAIQQYTNDTITEVFRTAGEGVLVDIGIGTGYQITRLIPRLKAEAPYLRELTIIGIEPNAEALDRAAEDIRSLSSENLRIRFIPVNKFAEELNLVHFLKEYNLTGRTLVINASFALHHIRAFEDRLVLFQKIKKMNPDLFILSEPDSDHYTPDLCQRFKNCFNHFKIVFRLIDTLDLSRDEKQALKLFFNREIEDILAGSDRVEKHSRTSLWLELMAMTGFTPQNYPFSEKIINTQGLEARWYPRGYWGLDFESETSISVLAMK